MKSESISMRKKVFTALLSCLLVLGMSSSNLQAFADNQDGDVQETYRVKFVATHSGVHITVKDSKGNDVEAKNSDKDMYELKPGSYTYSASAEGYLPMADKTFTVEKNQDIKVELVKKETTDKEVKPKSVVSTNKRQLRSGPIRGALSLDNVTINSFKIIDTVNGNKEIDYRTSDQPEYNSFKADPAKFGNAICENQTASKIKLSMAIEYSGDNVIQEGDTLSVPMKHGGSVSDFTLKPFLDGNNNQLGTWEYKNGAVNITFSGDYIKNNVVKNFKAKFETGEMLNTLDYVGKTFVLGERATTYGKIGAKDVAMGYEKAYVVSKKIGTTQYYVEKRSGATTDKDVAWYFSLQNDAITVDQKAYYCPYLLEHNGQYNPKTLKDICIEDQFTGNSGAPEIDPLFTTMFSGINDNDEVISGWYSINVSFSLLKKIDQVGKTKEEVKTSLRPGEYCVYDNKDGTYTLMLKWWDMDDPNGIKYDDIPQIKSAGGVGSYLKDKFPEIYGSLSQNTINKINDVYRNNALQNVRIYFNSKYIPVAEKTKVVNTAVISTNQTGIKSYPASAILTPPAGIGDAPADPLSIKMLKTDKDTGSFLSSGFNFELQTSTDNGANWTKVDLDASMVEIGTLNGDKTITPDAKGTVQVKKLTGGNMYRFVEKTHADGYQDVTVNNAQPNDKDHTTSANSKVVTVSTQGKGKVIVMYNAKPAKTQVKVTKKWEGPEKDSAVIKLLKNGQDSGKTLTLNKAGNWEGTFEDLLKYKADGREIEYDVKEVDIANYESTKTGDAKTGFTITNKNTEKLDIPVVKKWEGQEADSIMVELYADDKKIADKKITKADGWKYTFSSLKKFNASGDEIKYAVKEVPIEGYKTSISGNAKEGFTITNKYLTSPEAPEKVNPNKSNHDTKAPAKTKANADTKTTNSPNMGDDMNLVLLIMMILVSVGALGTVVVKRKKIKE